MSPAVSESIEIAAPAGRVWATVMDAHRLGEWVTTHEAVEGAGEGVLEQGASFTQRLRLAGKSFAVDWRVVEADPPRHARWQGEGPRGSTARVSYELSADSEDGPTRFDYENEFELPGGVLGKVAGGLLSAAPARREARRTLERLKRLLEESVDV